MAAAPHPAALIDTDVLIDAARGYPEASAFLREQHQTFRIQISIISAMELAVGSRNSTELSETKRFLKPGSPPPTKTTSRWHSLAFVISKISLTALHKESRAR